MTMLQLRNPTYLDLPGLTSVTSGRFKNSITLLVKELGCGVDRTKEKALEISKLL